MGCSAALQTYYFLGCSPRCIFHTLPSLLQPLIRHSWYLLWADYLFPYSTEKGESLRRDFPKAPSTTCTHRTTSVSLHFAFLLATREELSMLLPKPFPSVCTLDSISAPLPRMLLWQFLPLWHVHFPILTA